MIAIRNYSDTKNELEIARSRLNYLLDKKQQLYARYCEIRGMNLNDMKVQESIIKNDNMAEYVHELTKKRKNGLSYEQEIEIKTKEVDELLYYVTLMENNLKKMKAIEYKLYYAIVIEGRGITGGVEKTSLDTDKDISTIWKVYYPRIEPEIKKLQTKTTF